MIQRLLLTAALAASGANAAPAVTVFAAGDIAHCPHPDVRFTGAFETAAVVEAGLKADPAATVLTLGDHTYPRGRPDEYTACYGPTWGRFRDRTRPAPGNREYATANGAPYFAYFGKQAAGSYYSFDLGSWHLISLDSNLKGPAFAAQLSWLRDDLARHPARCTLAYWHHPLYSSGGHGSIAKMHDAWDLLYKAGAEIVLSGHDHDYERFAPQDADGRLDEANGMRQFVVGTGGAFATPFLWPAAHSEFRENTRHGVLRLRLREDSYEWQFMPVFGSESQGPAPDRGSGQCH
jgi:hypothetical protein